MNSIYHQTALHAATTTQAKAAGDDDEPIVQTLSGLDTTILEYITEASVALDYQWHVISYNRQTTQLIPDYQKELLGKNLWVCFPEIVGSLFYHKCLEAAATGKTAQVETKAQHLQKWFRIHILPSAECITIFLNDITTQKQAEEKLRFQANILHHIRDSVIVTDLQGEITYWNEGADHIFGYTPEEMIGRNIALLFPTFDAAQLTCSLEHIASGQDYSSQWQKRRQDGTEIWIEVKVTLLRNEEEQKCGFIGVAKDISERKLAEDQVGRSEKRFRALIENSADAIGLVTAQGVFLYASPSTQRVLGYLPEELVGRNTFRELVHPDDIELLRHVFAAILQEPGKSFSCEYRLRHKDGSWRWIEGNGLDLQDDPHVAAIVANYRDITKHKLLEEELRHSKEQLEAILTNTGDGILVQDVTGKLIYVNQTAASRLGFATIDDMLAAEPYSFLEWFDITDEEGQPFRPSHFPGRRAIMGEDNPQVTIRYVHKSTQKAQWNLIKSTLLRERNRTPLLIITVMQDITQFKELEQRKDEFIMHISHELRTPLTALSGFLQIINDFRSQLDESTIATFLSRSLENCQELTLLVNEVLDVLQFRPDKKSAQVETLSLYFIVCEVIAQLGPQKEQEYQFQLDISEQIMVRANRQYLCQILRNLLSNVVKYAPKQTPVIISATAQGDSAQETAFVPSVTISIQDAGPGIPLAEQQQLFEKFSRLKRDLASPVRGTGLGLYICKQLVEQMGGHIWVESSGRRGDGSRFCFTLPGNSPLQQEPTTF
ncbi:MAG TPA: PAS domain S-box protein [Ktedonobacteraceae bacterium]|nr:PAS domain S-box protein [Ktedonobacteraceae bacterium]